MCGAHIEQSRENCTTATISVDGVLNHRKIKTGVAKCGDQEPSGQNYTARCKRAEGTRQGGWFLTGIRLGRLRSDPSIPGHALALAIKKRVPTEVALDRRAPS